MCKYLLLIIFLINIVNGKVIKSEEWNLNLMHMSMSTKVANGDSNCRSLELLEYPTHVAGYIELEGTEDAHIFYMYFQNRYRKDDAPFLLWTNGGPGCSSLFGLFTENGPYVIQDDMSLCWSEYGWDIDHDIVFVDQPVNVGFSYSSSKKDLVYDEKIVSEDILEFLYGFYEIHPELIGKDFYLTGESFAGHYIPSIAHKIIQANSEKRGIYINMKGIAMGNPWVNPSLQYKTYPVYEYLNNLITKDVADEMLSQWPECNKMLSQYCDTLNEKFNREYCETVSDIHCELPLWIPIYKFHPNINVYDIRLDCIGDLCYDTDYLFEYLNQPEVKSKLDIYQNITWEECNYDVYHDMEWDMSTDVVHWVVELLDQGIIVVVYVGDMDLICNWVGNMKWLDEMDWPYKKEWNDEKVIEWSVDGLNAGQLKSMYNLTFMTVYDAGHMVPTDQPKHALDLIHGLTYRNQYWNIANTNFKEIL